MRFLSSNWLRASFANASESCEHRFAGVALEAGDDMADLPTATLAAQARVARLARAGRGAGALEIDVALSVAIEGAFDDQVAAQLADVAIDLVQQLVVEPSLPGLTGAHDHRLLRGERACGVAGRRHSA
jgi:hypothetical protein